MRKKTGAACFIFDLDGTIVDSNKAISVCYNAALTEMGYKRQSEEHIRKMIGLPLTEMFASSVEHGNIDEAVIRYRFHYQTVCLEETTLLPGAFSVLEELDNKGAYIGLATNKPSRFAKMILASLAVIHFFDIIVGPEDVARPKPHPDMLLHITNEANTHRKSTVFVGDSITDVITARRAGVPMYAVSSGSHTYHELLDESPDWTCRSLDGLLLLHDQSRGGHDEKSNN